MYYSKKAQTGLYRLFPNTKISAAVPNGTAALFMVFGLKRAVYKYAFSLALCLCSITFILYRAFVPYKPLILYGSLVRCASELF